MLVLYLKVLWVGMGIMKIDILKMGIREMELRGDLS